jgi:hypothetical protein
MNRHDIRLSWVDAEILEDWDEGFAEFIKSLLPLPDIVTKPRSSGPKHE